MPPPKFTPETAPLAEPEAELSPAEVGALIHRMVDYRVKTDSHPEVRTAEVKAVDPEQKSIFIEGRWIFVRDLEIKTTDGIVKQSQRPALLSEERRTEAISRAPRTRAREREKSPADNIPGAAGPDEFNPGQA